MQLSLIAAMTRNRVIGRDNQMPWHMPADLQHFKALTLHKPIIMGRKTFDSLGRALPKRRNIVLSRSGQSAAAGIEVFGSLEQALSELSAEPEVMIIGGQTLYEQALPLAQRVYLTVIEAELVGDAYFPDILTSDWQVVADESHAADEHNPYAYRFVTFARR